MQGVSATRPSPPQTSHTVARTTCPNGVRDTARSWPLPPQRSQVTIGVPGSAPFPWQRSQGAIASNETSTDVPASTSASSTSAVTTTSPPWTARLRPAEPNPSGSPSPPPKKASKMSANDPKPSKLGSKPPERSPSWP